MALNRYVLLNTVTIPWPATWSEVVNGPAAGAVTAPAVPASTVAAQNTYAFPVTVVLVAGGTISRVVVNGVTVGTGAGTYIVPSAGTIAVTWATTMPTWTWSAAPTGPDSGIGQDVLVAGTAPAGGQAGVLPQTSFLVGTPIVLDPAGALYAAIGGSNLRAWIVGTDNVSHACLGN